MRFKAELRTKTGSMRKGIRFTSNATLPYPLYERQLANRKCHQQTQLCQQKSIYKQQMQQNTKCTTTMKHIRIAL